MANPKEARWTHPSHAGGIRSPKLDVRGGKLLDDKRIHHYAKLGYYGTEVQAEALAKDEKPKKRKKESPLAQARKLLELLLKK